LFLLKPPVLFSPPDAFTCSRDAQLDCLSIIGGALFDASDTDDRGASDIDDRGAGSGGLENFRGRAPPVPELLVEVDDGNVLLELRLICPSVFLLVVGCGAEST